MKFFSVVCVSLLFLVGLPAGAQDMVDSTVHASKPSLKERKQCHRRCRRNAEPKACRQRCAAQMSKTGTTVRCCTAQWARCLACQKQLTVAAYCARFPDTRGCPGALDLTACCLEETAECIACQSGESIQDVCKKTPQLKGCEDKRNSEACSTRCVGDTNPNCVLQCVKTSGQTGTLNPEE